MTVPFNIDALLGDDAMPPDAIEDLQRFLAVCIRRIGDARPLQLITLYFIAESLGRGSPS